VQAPDADEPGSTTFNAQAWRNSRNERLIVMSEMNQEYACE
jgi:regulator-associated protein of mTOR